MVLINEIQVFELQTEMNFQCMILTVFNATVIKQQPEKFRPEQDLNSELTYLSLLL